MKSSQGAIFTIHPAKKENALEIKQLILESALNPSSLNWRNFYIAQDANGKLIACGQVKAHVDGSMELASLVVKKPWRHTGVGSALIKKLLEI